MTENGSVEAKGLLKESHYVLVAGLEGCLLGLELTDGNLFNQLAECTVTGCSDSEDPSMSPTGEEPTCPKFQPNIFDPSRCHDCLRQKHLHSGARESAEATPQQKPPAEPENAAKTQTDAGVGRVEGVALTPIPSQEEERDTSSKEDSDGVSAVSSYCDVRGGRVDYRETSLCILSSDCNLYICDGDHDDSTDSCLDHSDYQESSGSGSAEDEYLPIHQRSPKVGMTRLDPPPHRPNPRAWMEEAQSRSGCREDRQKRESGYFSLGRAACASLLRDKSPCGPFRHYERGHPIYSTENVDPKDTIPFRNPSLGVASERQKMTVLGEDLSLDILSPNADETAIEVEAQVGPRSPSPTPFKIAESLASTGRTGFGNSYSRGSPSSPSTYRHSGRFDTSRCGSPLQSRSSSPSRGNLPFGRCESAASIGRHASAGGGWTRGLEPGSPNSPQGGQRTHHESGTLPRNFKSFATSMKSQSSAVPDFRSALRKTEVSRTLNGCTRDGRSSSPSRRDHNPSAQASLRKTELSTGPLDGHRYGSGASWPSRKASGGVRDSCGSTPQRRNYCSSSPSLLRKSESVLSLNGHSHHGRCGSPIREGYDVESQTLLRNEMTRKGMNDEADESQTIPPSRRRMASHSVLQKSKSSPAGHTWDWHNQGSSPRRKDYQTSTQYQLRKTRDNKSLHGGTSESRSSSPLRRSHEMPPPCRPRSHDSNSAIRNSYNAADHRSLHKTEAGCSLNSTKHSSRNSSPSGKGYTDVPGCSVRRNATDGDSFHGKNTHHNSKSDSYYSSPSWRESSRSHRRSSLCRVASPSRQTSSGSRTESLTRETRRSPSVVRCGRPGHEENSPSLRDTPSRRPRTPSPSPPVQTQRHTSSQSSMESSESGPPSLRPSGRNREEYVMMADVPKVKIVHQREAGSHTGPAQSQRPPQRQELFKPASHSLSKHPSRDWEDTGDAEWHYSSSGYLSQAHWRTSLQRPDSPAADDGRSGSSNYHRSGQTQPDLLNFKKGWMSKLDDNGEWKKHWFVLSDAGLKYYRDSSAEEKDVLDGEIDLKSCLKVSEFDVEKNYGFQIQTREATFTLSAMTAGIRRNWIEVLKKCIRPSSSPDLTQLPDSSSDKENSHSRFGLPSHRPLPHRASVQPDPPASAPPTLRRFDYVELSPVPASAAPLSASQREAGEGQGREHSQWQEERNTSSQWEALLSRKDTGAGSNQRVRVEEEIEKKWAEFETLPLREMSSRPPLGSWTSKQSANEALQREVASLRQQLEELQGQRGGGEGGGGGGGDGLSVRRGCGPEAPCSRSLAAMEHAQRQALEELQRQHERQMKELENEKNRLLLEETQDTTRVIEALKKNHKEELEREVEKVRRLSSGGIDAQTLQLQHKAESQALQRELAGLSERYSQKCLELNRAEQNSAEREREICRKERDLEQLRKENQDLKARLKEEMSRVQSAVTDQRSEANKDRTCCELEVLLRMKENEIEYLHKEISCLRNELQFLNTEKRLACERYTEIHEELSGMRVRSEREIQNLKEHLSLAMAALQEGRKLGNSLDH